MRVEVSPLKRSLRRLEIIGEDSEAVLGEFLEDMVTTMHRDVIMSFRPPKSGKKYRRGRKVHQASAPGEAPAIDRGELARGIAFNIDKKRLIGNVVSTAPHGKWLEFGTLYIKPRPYMQPAADRVKEIAPEILRKSLRKALKKREI